MGILMAFAVGYVVGAQAGRQDFDDVVQSFKAIRESDEFSDLLRALGSHLSHTLRDVADLIDNRQVELAVPQDLVEQVRKLIRRV